MTEVQAEQADPAEKADAADKSGSAAYDAQIAYSVEVAKSDGSVVDVHLDKAFKVLGTEKGDAGEHRGQ